MIPARIVGGQPHDGRDSAAPLWPQWGGAGCDMDTGVDLFDGKMSFNVLLEISLLSWKGVHSILKTENIHSIVCVFDSIVVKICVRLCKHDGQGSLGCCSPWGRKELDTTEQLN